MLKWFDPPKSGQAPSNTTCAATSHNLPTHLPCFVRHHVLVPVPAVLLSCQAEKAGLASAVNRLQDELESAQAAAASASTQLNASRTLLQSRAAQVGEQSHLTDRVGAGSRRGGLLLFALHPCQSVTCLWYVMNSLQIMPDDDVHATATVGLHLNCCWMYAGPATSPPPPCNPGWCC
jgi:hypothetical protein